MLASISGISIANHLEGVYINDIDLQRIEVIQSRNFLKVQGIYPSHPHRWVKFRSVGVNRFVDRHGNRLAISMDAFGYPLIDVRYHRGGCAVYKYLPPRNVHDHICHSGCNHGTCMTPNQIEYYDDRLSNRNRSYGNRRTYDFNDRNRLENHDQRSSRNIEGTYLDPNNRQIAIVLTRTGFKAKFSGERTWKDYTKTGNRFLDENGNSYEWLDNGVLKWEGRSSGHQILIRKISDDVKY